MTSSSWQRVLLSPASSALPKRRRHKRDRRQQGPRLAEGGHVMHRGVDVVLEEAEAGRPKVLRVVRLRGGTRTVTGQRLLLLLLAVGGELVL